MGTESNPDSGSAESAEQDVQNRLRLAEPEFTTRGILFSTILQVVEDVTQDEVVVRRCQETTGEKSFIAFFQYPTRSLLMLLAAAADALSLEYGSFEGALRQIAMPCALAFLETPVGRAALQHTGDRPQRFMLVMQTLYDVLATYFKTEVSYPSSNTGVLAVRSTLMPLVYHEGAALAIAERMGVKLVRVRARKTSPLGVELEMSW